MNNELISIVLPIYNVEKYLTKCIETVINQTYKNIEVILVDDGSTDSSSKICDEFKKKDGRIKVIHKKNGGLSDARNAGLQIAKGKYISFIDSDDFVDLKYIEELYNSLKKNNSDIAMCNFQRIQSNDIVLTSSEMIKGEFSNIEILEKLYDKKLYPASVVAWNKLYDIKLFNEIKYPIGKIHEDEYTTYKLYYNAKKISVTSNILYYYRIVETSIMNKKFNNKRLDIIEALEEQLEFFYKNNEEKLYNLTLIQYEFILFDLYIKCRKNIKDSKKTQKQMLIKYREEYRKIIKIKECSKINKFKFTIIYISPIFYYIIKKIIKC